MMTAVALHPVCIALMYIALHRGIPMTAAEQSASLPPVTVRAWNWLRALVLRAIPDRRAYMLATMRLTASLAVLAVVSHVPPAIRPPVEFMGNMLFFLGVWAILGPAEHTLTGGVLDKVEERLFGPKQPPQ
jgi:hypothetical protein